MKEQFKNNTLGFLTLIKNDKGSQFFTTFKKDELISKFGELVNSIDTDEVIVSLDVKKKEDGKSYGILKLRDKKVKGVEGVAVIKKKAVEAKDII